MSRIAFVLLLWLGTGLAHGQESLKPIPESAASKPHGVCAPCSVDDRTCICPLYPVWWDEETPGTYLYLSEICAPTSGCPVIDVGYRVDGPLAWPLECDPTPCGECENNGEILLRTPRITTLNTFPGLRRAFPSKNSLQQMLPSKVLHPDTRQSANPQRGIKRATEFYVRFKVDADTIYAKLFVSSVKSSDANAPRNVTIRPMLVGFEIQNDADLPIDEVLTAPRVTLDDARFKAFASGKQAASSRVKKVSLDGRLHFLVLLANRPTPVPKPGPELRQDN